MARVIVIGVDLSPCSRRALDAGVRLAMDLDAAVVVVHAFEPGPVGLGISGGAVHADIQQSIAVDDEEEARRLSSEWLADARAQGADVSIVAESVDDPAKLIVDQAKQADAALIVVGTHGRRGLTRLLMGSVAEAVVRTSDRPVLVVPGR